MTITCERRYPIISIHAPPRGATYKFRKQHVKRFISIHAPPRGATITADYNPIENYISIHAPPRGATSEHHPSAGQRHPISIHAPPRGATRNAPTSAHTHEFQFTPLREGRRAAASMMVGLSSISIHAPPRGATPRKKRDFHEKNYFNSRPSARGDGHPHGATGNAEISIHAPPRGATEAVGMVREKMVFQFTPLREGRQTRNQGDFRREHFNSRPSARGDQTPKKVVS